MVINFIKFETRLKKKRQHLHEKNGHSNHRYSKKSRETTIVAEYEIGINKSSPTVTVGNGIQHVIVKSPSEDYSETNVTIKVGLEECSTLEGKHLLKVFEGFKFS